MRSARCPRDSARETGGIVTAEEHLLQGGLGTDVARVVAQGHIVPLGFVGIDDTYAESGELQKILEKYGLTSEHIYDVAKEVIDRKK